MRFLWALIVLRTLAIMVLYNFLCFVAHSIFCLFLSLLISILFSRHKFIREVTRFFSLSPICSLSVKLCALISTVIYYYLECVSSLMIMYVANGIDSLGSNSILMRSLLLYWHWERLEPMSSFPTAGLGKYRGTWDSLSWQPI